MIMVSHCYAISMETYLMIEKNMIISWLVLWNIFFIFLYTWNNHPNWLMFFRGVEIYHQPELLTVYQDIVFSCPMLDIYSIFHMYRLLVYACPRYLFRFLMISVAIAMLFELTQNSRSDQLYPLYLPNGISNVSPSLFPLYL